MYRLHKGLIEEKIESTIFCFEATSDDNSVVKFRYPGSIISRLKRQIRNKKTYKEFKNYSRDSGSSELFTSDRTPYRQELIEQLPEADIYHLHWISRFVDIPTFFEQVQRPAVWTFHDMNPFTGGCHYDEGCGKYETGCGICPQIGSDSENDLSKTIFNRKKEAIATVPSNKFRAVADSYWIAEEAQKSSIFEGKKVDTIHYGLDHELFKPLDKKSIRTLLEIPENRPVILFGAPGLRNKRKGFRELSEALNNLKAFVPDIFLLTFGNGELPSDLNINYLHLGNISNDRYLSMVYNAADVFVIPSLQEAFGQTCLEAMACGVPCAGFNTGGIPDMIIPGETGFLADPGSPESLAEAISQTLKQKEELGMNARARVEGSFTLRHQAEAYINVYNELLKDVS